MEISIKTAELKPILNKLTYAKEVTGNQKSLFINANDNKAKCIICDPINSIKVEKILAADIVEEGDTLIPHNLFKVIQAIDKPEIEIIDNKIICNNQIIEYKSGNPDNFAMHTPSRKDFLFSIPQKELYRLIKSTFYAVAQDETRPILTGLNINKNKFIGLDGYRLAISESEKFNIDASITLSEPTVKALLKLLDKKSDDIVNFYTTKKQNYVIIEINKILVTSRLLDGVYINYKSIIPDGFSYEIEIDVKELLKKLKFMFELKKSAREIAKLTIDHTKLYIENSNSTADIKDSMGINVIEHGDLPFTIAFNPLYLRDALRKYNTLATIQCTTSSSPVIVKADNNLDLILPVRLKVGDKN